MAYELETLAIHAGAIDDQSAAAVAPPLTMSTTFHHDPDGTTPRGFLYGTLDNPNRKSLEAAVAALEGGRAALAFASGSAATKSVFMALRPGDHVIAPTDAYYGTTRLLREIFDGWGLHATFADMADLAAVRAALRPQTKLVWVESPSNPMLRISDIAALATLARKAGAWCVCDNTFATPVLQRPLQLGAHASLHASTKYFGGHSDVVGGAIVLAEDDALCARLRTVQRYEGAVPSPFDCWLISRGLRTLPLRVRQHAANASAVATFLALHPKVRAVHYPGLASHPNHAVAAAQMRAFGGIVSAQIAGGSAAAQALCGSVRLFACATSFGGTESLIEHRKSIEGPQSPTPDDLVRIAVGLENVDDLIADLEAALATL